MCECFKQRNNPDIIFKKETVPSGYECTVKDLREILNNISDENMPVQIMFCQSAFFLFLTGIYGAKMQKVDKGYVLALYQSNTEEYWDRGDTAELEDK